MTVIILLTLCVFLFYRIQVWRDLFEGESTALERMAVEKAELQKSHDFLKESVVSWNTKPVYALLSDQQITAIAKTVAEAIKEPKWVN